jgi:hypothetical protein
MFKDLHLGDDTDATVKAEASAEQSFLRKYVSFSVCMVKWIASLKLLNIMF